MWSMDSHEHHRQRSVCIIIAQIVDKDQIKYAYNKKSMTVDIGDSDSVTQVWSNDQREINKTTQ